MSLVSAYKDYFLEGTSSVAHEILSGAIGVISYSKYGITGFFTAFILIDLLGFAIHLKEWDKLDNNPMYSRAKTKKMKKEGRE